MTNKDLHKSKRDPHDEFYTKIETIEREMAYHRDSFFGKRVYCNCDSPESSAFVRYFKREFFKLGLKGLVCTAWNESGHGVYESTLSKGGKLFSHRCQLSGDGDFASDECRRFIDDCDVVASNPPFSKGKQYLSVLLDSGRDFLVLGSQTWLTLSNMREPIVSGRVRVGRSILSGSTYFDVPTTYSPYARTVIAHDGVKSLGVNAIRWFTTLVEDTSCDRLALHTMSWNLDNDDGLRELLKARFNVSVYPKYDNLDAIEVPTVKAIPSDYAGLMGVPVTFLLNHDPDQFEIVSMRKGDDGRDLSIDGKSLFCRVIIRNKELANASC